MSPELARRLRRAALFTLAVGAAALLVSLAPPWREQVEIKLFDQLTALTTSGKSVLPITIIGIDEASFAQVDKRWPWPRELHANVIKRLSDAGAAVIAIDLVFSEPDPTGDPALAKAIAEAGNVVLAADFQYQETALVRQWIRVDPAIALTQAGAITGLASVALDTDKFVRRIPQAPDAFWRRIIQTLIRARPGVVEEPYVGESLIRHIGPAETFPYVSFHRLLQNDSGLPADYFRDHLVLIGVAVRSSPDIERQNTDLFATPFLATSGRLTPGVEVHATIVENALTGQAITEFPRTWGALLTIVALLLAAPALVRWHPVWSGAWIVAVGSGVVGLAVWNFQARNVWIPIGSILTALVALYVANGVSLYIAERRRKEQITNAFGKYVSPEVVKQIVAEPELLKLGGKRAEVTVLFTDLAGFTSITERMTPENVAKMMNTYFTAMTRIVMAGGGTVDKFIGDAIMAFWGAPIEDPQHALHAVTTAVRMQEEMQQLRQELAQIGGGAIAMRIGLNSGPVIVGNMGSEDRFDYTVMGDTVNLASRLEGINKFYKTDIMISESTALLMPPEFSLRKVDVVRAAGKKEPVAIYTPCNDAELVRRTNEAFNAYLRQEWANARAAWASVKEHTATDGVATLFTKRIEEFERNPPPTEWDGAADLQKG